MAALPRYDACVVGLGAAGSQVAWQLARRGRRVLGLDRHEPPHDRGSSHGGSRIIREAYFEGAGYVPLVRRAYELWDELERAAGVDLLEVTGGLWIGAADGPMVTGCRDAAAAHDVAIRVLDAGQARAEFPVFAVPDGLVAVHEARAGILHPEAAVAAALRLARDAGADLRTGQTARGWEAIPGGVRVTTQAGTFDAAQLVLAAGPWTAELAPGLAAALTVERQVAVWLEASEPAGAAGMPVWFWDAEPGLAAYGFPPREGRLKLALHHHGDPSTPDAVDRVVHARDTEPVARIAETLLGPLAGPVADASVCLYTNTPDENFAIGPLPGHDRVTLVSACSGHGFKFASAVGEAAADLVDGAEPRVSLAAFDPARLVA